MEYFKFFSEGMIQAAHHPANSSSCHFLHLGATFDSAGAPVQALKMKLSHEFFTSHLGTYSTFKSLS
jgi:hypothetical protein